MKQKINYSLLLVSLIAVLTTLLGSILVFYNIFQQRVQHDLTVNAELIVKSNLFQGLYNQLDGRVIDSDSLLFETLHPIDVRITWVDQDGRVLFDNDADAQELASHYDRPEIQDAMETGVGESIRLSTTIGMNTYYYAVKLENGTILRVSAEARSIQNLLLTAVPVIFLILILILMLCGWLTHVLTKNLLKPFDRLAEHLDDNMPEVEYEELAPFVDKIRSQHENILAAVKSRQDFTANVSHELKTPLTAISGYAELIENGMVEGEQIGYISSQIRHNSDRLRSLINDIIKLSELDHTEHYREHQMMDLYQVAAGCCEALQINAVTKGLRLKLLGNSVMMKGDREMIREMIMNLIQNSIQYSNEGGYVNVIVRMEGIHPTIHVEDDGIGIPKDQQERVFERFYRVDKSRSRDTGGTGLGLAIVKHIAEIHNAQIVVEGDLGKGTRITIHF